MTATTQICFLCVGLGKHGACSLDVTLLAAVRCTHQRQIGFVEVEPLERARLDNS